MPAVVDVSGLKKSYGAVAAVQGIDLQVQPGEIVGLLGPNGAGKTTALECIIGLRRPDAGAITICGVDARRDTAAMREKIGVQLQATSLPEQLRVREALALFASFYRQPVSLTELIERFSLGEKLNASFSNLSGGQKQRLAMALAVINDPQVLFLDEPTAAMDPQGRRELHSAITEMRGKGRSVLITTHHIDEAEQLCDRVAIIDHGKVIAHDTPANLVAKAQAATRIVVGTDRALEQAALNGFPGVSAVTQTETSATLTTTAVNQTLVALVHHLDVTGIALVDLQIRKPSLEDVFIELTGRSLRD